MMKVLLAIGVLVVSAPTLEAQEPAGGDTVQVNDIELHYRLMGEGDPLVLLHGFGGCGQNWQPFTDQLAEHYRLIIPDLRGHGHSTNPGGTFSHRQSASDVIALLDSVGIERFKAMGISTGGMTLLHIATRWPERVEAMILIGATSYFPEEARSIMQGVIPDSIPRPVEEHFRACAQRGDEQVRELAAQFNAFQDSYDDMNFTGPYLSTISARTLIVHGDRDAFFPVEIPVEMYRSIPDAALWIIPEGAHVPIYDPGVSFAATALRFLDPGFNQ